MLEDANLISEIIEEYRLNGCLYQCQLQFQEHCVIVVPMFTEGKGIAVLNEETGKVLQQLLSLSSCRFEAYLLVEQWEALVEQKIQTGMERFIFIDIVLYGSKKIRDNVGKKLSSARMYLQHPCFCEEDVDYDNPHFLKFNGLPSSQKEPEDIGIGSSIAQVDLGISPGQGDSPYKEMAPGAILRRKMETVFDSLTRSKTLKRIEADIRIITPLLA